MLLRCHAFKPFPRMLSLARGAAKLSVAAGPKPVLQPIDSADRGKTATTVVSTREHALRVLEQLKAPANRELVWACDTEVADIDVKEQSPVGNGKVICVSIYGGDSVDFGSGSTLWIENAGAAEGVLGVFKDWFESQEHRKVWHNYGFDRHVMANEGIRCGGLAGDTMHMSRLWDSSRDKTSGGDGYSLASLTATFFKDDDPRFVKTSMKQLFGVAKLKKDGTPSVVKTLPDLMQLQVDPVQREDWIEYSARDAVATWCVHRELEKQLRLMPWVVDGRRLGDMLDYYQRYMVGFAEVLTDMEAAGIRVDTAGHLQQAEQAARAERSRMQQIFTAWAADMTGAEAGALLNLASTAQIQQLLFGHYEQQQLLSKERVFRLDKTDDEVQAEQAALLQQNPYALMGAAELKDLLRGRGLRIAGNKADQLARLRDYDERLTAVLQQMPYDDLVEKCNGRGLQGDWVSGSGSGKEDASPPSHAQLAALYLQSEIKANLKKASADSRKQQKLQLQQQKEGEAEETTASSSSPSPSPSPIPVGVKKYREITIRSVGMVPKVFTPGGLPQVSAALLKKLAGRNLFGDPAEAKWGDAFDFFGGGEAGMQACRAIGALAAVGQVDATINNFLVPLQALVDKNSRVHCSLNLNTETGRLSSRKPNLQNQPALEKDQYKIRDAFVAEEGKTFIVADYGQLELRVLAHITGCASMIAAFKDGGCFHSRTAMGMFPYIKEAVDSGRVMLEWDYSKGQPTVPLVKDSFASERRKAKTLNFSIAYGKTVHGLALDWGISKEEAQETLDAWYRDRPEVKDWQQRTQELAKKGGYVRTIMGRYRRLPDAGKRGPGEGHALRAAINTPIQGSAADIVMMAMVKLWRSETLRRLGWQLLLQIHDEVIVEGPIESREEAMREVVQCMENPYDDFGLAPLSVHLDVDAKSANTWYKAK